MGRYDDEACVYIPFEPEENKPSAEDLLNEAHLNAYKHVWSLCLSRIEDVSHRINDEIVTEAVEHVLTAYSAPLPGLPYSEVPALMVGGGPTIISFITSKLKSPYHDNDHEDEYIGAHVSHLQPAECGNVMNTMKALVSGFLASEEASDRRRAATSLASYDINLLRAWYKELIDHW